MKLMMRVIVKLPWIPVIEQKREINTKEKWLTTWLKCCSRTLLKPMKHSCLRGLISETHPPPRRQFDVLREKIDL